jgi:hypothetical protein
MTLSKTLNLNELIITGDTPVTAQNKKFYRV